jgi:hypothetical protein
VCHCLGDLQPFVPERTALGERAQFGMARGEKGQGLHIREIGLTEAFTTPRTLEGRHSLPKAVDCVSIATLGPVCSAKEEVRQGIDDGVPSSRRKRERALGRDNGLVIRTEVTKMD